MRDSFLMAYLRDQEDRLMKMEDFMKESSIKVKKMEKEHIIGPMDLNMKVVLHMV